MGKERLIKILNDLVAVEIAAVTEYQQHAYMSEDSKIIDLMEDFSMDEMSHIELFSREVARLGGEPTVIPKKIKEAGKTFEELVQRDIEVEAEAMKRLTEYMKVADEEGNQRVQKLLQDIYADEKTHYDTLVNLLNPPQSTLTRIRDSLDIGTGLIMTGLFWLYLWLFPHFPAYLSDPRWAHNFAFPLILLTIGVAYKEKKLSTDLVAALSAFMVIPTESGVLSGVHSTIIVSVLLVIILLLIAVERGRKRELLFFQHRWRRWLKKHLLTFSYLFLMHMAFIYWFTRVLFGEPAEVNLPSEMPWDPVHWGTAAYNILVIPFGLIGMAERFRGTLRRRISALKLGYWWSLLIIIVGIGALGIASGAWLIYGGPLIVSLVILTLSIIACKRKS